MQPAPIETPEGSVLGTTLLALSHWNDLSSSAPSAETYILSDDTTVFFAAAWCSMGIKQYTN